MNNSKLQKQADKWGKVHCTLHIRYLQGKQQQRWYLLTIYIVR